MSDTPNPYEQVKLPGEQTCPHCGAQCPPSTLRCWLCFGEIAGAPVEIVTAELIERPGFSRGSQLFFGISSALLAIFLSMMNFGLYLQEPGAGVVMTIGLLIPLAATVVREQLRRRRVGPMSWAERFTTFMVSTAVTASIAIGLVIAAFVALLIACFVNPPRWH